VDVGELISSEDAAVPPSQSRAILRDLLIVVAVGAGIWLAHRLGRILLVLILAMFFAYVIAPLVELVQSRISRGGQSRRLPRGAAIAVVYLIPVLAFLMLRDTAGIRRTILTALPHRIRLRGHRLFEELNATLAAYVRAQLIACVVVGSVSGVGFALLGSPYAILLGVLPGVLEFIPLIGPLVVAAVAVMLAALHDPMLALWTAAFLTVLRVVEDYVIYPRLIGRDIDLHPLVVILAVLGLWTKRRTWCGPVDCNRLDASRSALAQHVRLRRCGLRTRMPGV
jgi:predicted PurR-regulated permease PerM